MVATFEHGDQYIRRSTGPSCTLASCDGAGDEMSLYWFDTGHEDFEAACALGLLADNEENFPNTFSQCDVEGQVPPNLEIPSLGKQQLARQKP
ncbi:hypothetical protein ElyMa_005415300 [Elysia marginata]|uniref:Ig-like domain-containing protein n=1 Tax=Elysia marginata TaxID=1093978 RepID=A0AAV4EJK7_9GAST|nr:hypothetical protein ElyMa_005415300 [Elysia marginata]